jgi:hypothetical protein
VLLPLPGRHMLTCWRVHAQAELQRLFAAEGFCCDDIKVHQRFACNRALQTTMERHWVQATFTYQGPGEQHG